MKEFIKRQLSIKECACENCKEKFIFLESRIARLEEQLSEANILEKLKWGLNAGVSSVVSVLETQKQINETLSNLLKEKK